MHGVYFLTIMKSIELIIKLINIENLPIIFVFNHSVRKPSHNLKYFTKTRTPAPGSSTLTTELMVYQKNTFP